MGGLQDFEKLIGWEGGQNKWGGGNKIHIKEKKQN